MIKVPYAFLKRLREPIGWAGLKYGYTNQFVEKQVLIDHACEVLLTSSDENVVEIAIFKSTVDISAKVDRLVCTDEADSDQATKWAKILVAFINESDRLDKLNAVEEVYSSLGYPEMLAGMVRYMPTDEPDLGSKEANENRMLERLKEFAASVVTAK